MPKKKTNLEKILENVNVIIDKSKDTFTTIKKKSPIHLGHSIWVIIILVILLSTNIGGSCNSKLIDCDYKYSPDIDKLKEVIKKK